MSTLTLLADAAGPAGGASPAPLLVWSGLWAWAGYAQAQRSARENGRSPWGLSPAAWSVVCFLLSFLGALALLVAGRRDARKAPPAAWPPPPQQAWPAPPVQQWPVQAWAAPAPEQPAGPPPVTGQPPVTGPPLARDVLPGR